MSTLKKTELGFNGKVKLEKHKAMVEGRNKKNEKKNAAENLLKIIGFQASPGVQVTVALIIIHNGLKKGKERNFKVSSHFSAGALTGNSVN